VAKSFARIHWQNLANFGVLALEFDDESDYERVEQGDTLVLEGLHDGLREGSKISARLGERDVALRHRLSPRQVDKVLAGGAIPVLRRELDEHG
jgi:aconitate hydratase